MYQVTVSGSSLAEVVANMQAFIATTGGDAAAKKTPGSKKGAAVASKPEPGVENEKQGPDNAAPEQPSEPAADAVAPDNAKLREQALDRLRDLYATGKEGQAKVNKIAKQFGVKKLGDVPVEKAGELMDAVIAEAGE